MVSTRRFAHTMTHRHSERSEAIHSFLVRNDGLLRIARNDVDGHDRAFSRRVAPELCCYFSAQKKRAQGRPGAGWHPRSRVLKCA
jgi:hypothetical protein